MISPIFDPKRVLLLRIFFINDDKSKYFSVSFYHAKKYQPLLEFVGGKLWALTLSEDYPDTMI
jgi:hypothetical protein